VGARLCRAIIAQQSCAPTRFLGAGAEKSRADLFSASQGERLTRLNGIAIRQMQVLTSVPAVKQLKG
jgi:hypothetical protein